jgi:hypothetical protein
MAASSVFLGLESRRLLDILKGQLSQRYLRFTVGHSIRMAPAFGRLIQQIDRTFRHGASIPLANRLSIIMGASRADPVINNDHSVGLYCQHWGRTLCRNSSLDDFRRIKFAALFRSTR